MGGSRTTVNMGGQLYRYNHIHKQSQFFSTRVLHRIKNTPNFGWERGEK